MPHVSDCEYAVLTSPPFSYAPAHVHDLELQWLHQYTSIPEPDKSPNLKDAWRQFLDQFAKDVGSIQDQQYAWLTGIGAPEGSVQDKLHWFWCVKGDGNPAPAAFDMNVFAACISAQGWTVMSHDADSIDIEVGVTVYHITVLQIVFCNPPAGLPVPLEIDLLDCAQAQGFCL